MRWVCVSTYLVTHISYTITYRPIKTTAYSEELHRDLIELEK